MSRRQSRVTGTTKLTKILRRVEPEVRGPVGEAVREGLDAIKWDAVAAVPKDSGDLAASIDWIQSADGLSGAVGPAAKSMRLVKRSTGSAFNTAGISQLRLSDRNKKRLFQFFKGYWLEFGTKGRSGAGAITPRPFMRPAWDVNRRFVIDRVGGAMQATLRRIVGGG